MYLSIPSDIASYLTPDEKIVIIGSGAQGEIYATNKRLILKREGILGRKGIVEVSYRHISSIEYEKKISIGLIVAGICVVILALLMELFRPMILRSSILLLMLPSTWTNVVILVGIIGAILIIGGVAQSAQDPTFTMYVVGRSPVSLRGKNLEGFIKVVREYREEIIAPEKASPAQEMKEA
jgi:hypothetical protein